MSQSFSSDERMSHPWRQLIVGGSAAIQQLCSIIELIAPKKFTVLIAGETGTGKEVIAKAIHAASSRSSLPMVSVNCTTLPANLLEAELFGHTKGAFTGAYASRIGHFEQAHRSTIFLDEIGDLPLEAQAKLLRVLQEQELQRVGSSETVRIDVRVIAASNMDLEKAVADRRFREDLFYRLNVVPISLPPLRERIEDVPLLAEHLLLKICKAERLGPKQISPEALEWLGNQDWPGNVRQLEHAIQRAVALNGNKTVLEAEDFQAFNYCKEGRPKPNAKPLVVVPREGLDFEQAVRDFEASLLQQSLALTTGNKAKAAELLGLKRTTLLAKLKILEHPEWKLTAADLDGSSSEEGSAASSSPTCRVMPFPVGASLERRHDPESEQYDVALTGT